MSKCGFCKRNIDDLNPPVILKPLTSLGYKEIDFCCSNCFKEYIKKKLKLVDKNA